MSKNEADQYSLSSVLCSHEGEAGSVLCSAALCWSDKVFHI